MNTLEINNLSKFYGDFQALNNVNIKVEQGEIYGFIGPNGAGKSTTIRTVLGLLKPSEGTTKVFGLDSQRENKLILEKIGYLPAEVNYYDEMNSKALLEYSARFYKNADTSKIESLADYFELDLTKKIRALSFGNKKKCAIIQSLLHSPELLILDEPTTGLDPLMQNRFFDLLEEENKKGVTVFFSSHILSDIERVCQRAAVIKKGEIVAVEDIKELIKKQVKQIKLVLALPQADINFPAGASEQKVLENKVSFSYDGDLNELAKWLTTQNLEDVQIIEPTLDTVFINYYEN
ncbi:MAG: ABC-2 type transport system ATP-binding protein [Parvicellaceae bacterium]|jgi:ABC-2 type transport system ATP-binding protein